VTDSFVEETLIAAFKTLSLIKSKVVSAKTIYNYSEINKTFDKSNWLAEGWYELDMIPGEPYQAELGTGGRNRWVGIMQITVCVPLNVGKTMANARYDAIAGLFPRGAYFSGVEITNVYRGPESTESDHYRLPVVIAYRADLEN
jgi:hypothetical protein